MQAKPTKVLLIEDERVSALKIQLLLGNLPGNPFTIECADRLATGLDRLARGGIDVVLLDLTLPDSEGLETLLRVRAQAPQIPVVVLTGLDDDQLGLTAMQHGAEDFLVKGQVNFHGLRRALHYAIERTLRRQAEEIVRANSEEFRFARAIQQKLLPTVPRLASFDMGGMSNCAAGTCGDYFDFIRMLDGSLGFVIADVCGHGLGPALVMASTRAYVRALARTHANVGDILTVVNHALAEDDKEGLFVTLILACLNLKTRSLVYASAGHPTAYVLDAAGTVQARLESTGLPLGVVAETRYTASEPLTLAAEDMVLFLTDGIVEARAPDQTEFGAQRALDIVRIYRKDPAAQIVDNLYGAVRAFCQDEPQVDDMSAVILKVGPASS